MPSNNYCVYAVLYAVYPNERDYVTEGPGPLLKACCLMLIKKHK